MLCRTCRLHNRTRAILHFLRQHPVGSGPVFFTEQVTPLYRAAALLFPRIVGSEFLRDGTRPGHSNAAGIRHEDMTQLSFADASLDVVCTCDVLEHVPDTASALAECFRCLKPGGLLLISVPFRVIFAETLVRARIGAAGDVEHIEPPEYHGDPMDGAGALCFYHFGWDFLDALRAAGFADVSNRFYWSDRFGHFGDGQQLIAAIKG
jgi:SAM-dependent methyltransferase